MKGSRAIAWAVLLGSAAAMRSYVIMDGMEMEMNHLLQHGMNNITKESRFSKTARIAVVGAGPGGLHMASRLKKL